MRQDIKRWPVRIYQRTHLRSNASAAGRERGIEILAPAALSGFGSASRTAANVAIAASFEAEEFRIDNLLIAISEKEISPEADGLIGLDVFKDFLIRIRPRSRKMDLTPLPAAESGAICDGCEPTYSLDHLLLVQGTVNGRAQGYFLLDTGAPYTMISRNAVPKLGRAIQISGVQGAQDAEMGAMPLSLRIGALRMREFEYATLDADELGASNGAQIMGAIGFSLLRDLSLTLNYRDGFVKFEMPGGPSRQ